MGFKVTLLDPKQPGVNPLKLVDSPQPLNVFNIRLNHQPVFEFRNIANAAFAFALFHGNRRNILSFETRRNVDAGDKKFSDIGGALTYAIGLTNIWPGLCIAQIEFSAGGQTKRAFMQNCAAHQCDLGKVNGIELGYSFALNGGVFTQDVKGTQLFKS